MSDAFEPTPPMEIPFTIPVEVQRDPVMQALEDCFGKLSDFDVLQHCIGVKRISNIPDFAEEAANHIIVVCLDCEHWSNNTEETTEVGIATFFRQDVAPLVEKGDFGDFGENLLRKVQFNLLRLKETSHLPNQNPNSRGVLGNRFGQWRFVSFAEARQIMRDLFVQPIQNVPGLRGNHPLVVLGHDVGHDKNNLKNKAIGFDMDPLGTVVRYVDTQVLARQQMYWSSRNNEQVGLRRLVEILHFEHSDPHTAANDAARTLISAFQIGIGKHKCWVDKKGKERMLEVANRIEEYSVANFKSIGGVREYCWRCGQDGHMKSACTATDLHCDECEANKCKLPPGEDHITAHCMCLANEKAALRRERDLLARAQKRQRTRYTPRERSSSHENDGSPPSDRPSPPTPSPSQIPSPRQTTRYTPRGRTFSHENNSSPPSRGPSRPAPSPSQVSFPRQMNGHESTFNSRRGQPLNGNWRARSSNGPSNELGNGNNGFGNSNNNLNNGNNRFRNDRNGRNGSDGSNNRLRNGSGSSHGSSGHRSRDGCEM